jgi:hypothetical protein
MGYTKASRYAPMVQNGPMSAAEMQIMFAWNSGDINKRKAIEAWLVAANNKSRSGNGV